MKLQEMKNEALLFKGIYEEGTSVYVKLGAKVYIFTEDPDDGYRSYMMEPEEVEAPEKAKFSFETQPVVLFARYTDAGSFTGLELYLSEDLEVCVAQFGTDHMDDYYPCATSYVDVVKINQEFFNK